MNESMEPSKLFPRDGVPEPAAHARLAGLYPQIQEGRWMQRVKVFGGSLLPEQWKALAGVARQHTPETPLHLTTRQDLEIHDLTAGQVGAVQLALAEAGLTALGACGDTIRNVTVCPCAGVRPGTVHLAELAKEIHAMLQSMPGAFALPRKFKVSLSSCEKACAQPWINDLGLVARRRDGKWGFEVMAAGSLGPRPSAGIRAFEWIPAAQALPLAQAAMTLFTAQGDRDNRGKARLRHVRERLGNEAFLRLLSEEFGRAKARHWPALALVEVTDGLPAVRALTFPNGDVTPAMAEALGELAARPGMALRLGNQHRAFLFARSEAALDEALAREPALAGPARPQPVVVACPGRRWCARGLTDTNAMAGRIRTELAASLPAGARVCVSGCPNGCAHSAVADVGLTGCLSGGAEAYNLFRGGGMGCNDRLASPAGTKLIPEAALAEIARHS